MSSEEHNVFETAKSEEIEGLMGLEGMPPFEPRNCLIPLDPSTPRIMRCHSVAGHDQGPRKTPHVTQGLRWGTITYI